MHNISIRSKEKTHFVPASWNAGFVFVFVCELWRELQYKAKQAVVRCFDLDASIRMSMAGPINVHACMCACSSCLFLFQFLFLLRRCIQCSISIKYYEMVVADRYTHVHKSQFNRRFVVCVHAICVIRELLVSVLYIQSEIMGFRFSLTISMNVNGAFLIVAEITKQTFLITHTSI